jgi:cytoskeletal protein CcmA (bactofilin family)
MWKPNSSSIASPSLAPAPAHLMPNAISTDPVVRPAVPLPDISTIGKGLVFSGEITGTEPLLVEGRVEGSINLPGGRVTVGRNGQVNATITAREIVVQGKIRGNLNAADRVEIRSEGALIGDIATARVSIEDGAFFQGGIDIRKAEHVVEPTPAPPSPTPGPADPVNLVLQ